jgi:ATP-dependent exoDNAse (exonuclease V) beta subunit
VRLEHVRAVLTEALAERDGATAADWLEATWVRLGAPDAYAAAELPDARAFFAALAARAGAFEWRGPRDLPALLEHLHSTPAPAAPNPVQVMTIYRAKGLEFDHVLVPALERVTRADGRRLLRWVDLPSESGESDLIIAPVAATGAREEGALNAYLKELFRRRDANERTRLLYVAATRARRTLWLSGAPLVSERAALKPDRRSPLGQLWPALAERFESEPSAAVVRAPNAHGTALTRLASGWSAPALPPALPLVRLPAAHLAAEPPEFSWVGETQRHIGTVVHAWLARLTLRTSLPEAPELATERAAVLAQLRRLGVPERELARAAGLVLEAVQGTLADERGRWILSAAHREARAELALTGVSAGRLRNIVIDRSFVDTSGTRWVIDFKTSRHEGGGLAAFLDEEVARYREQLSTYAGLARALGPEPVRAGLYFPLLQVFREV